MGSRRSQARGPGWRHGVEIERFYFCDCEGSGTYGAQRQEERGLSFVQFIYQRHRSPLEDRLIPYCICFTNKSAR